MNEIDRIHRRQVARLLDHLKDKGELTPELESDIKRSFGFVFKDVHRAVRQGTDKNECENVVEGIKPLHRGANGTDG